MTDAKTVGATTTARPCATTKSGADGRCRQRTEPRADGVYRWRLQRAVAIGLDGKDQNLRDHNGLVIDWDCSRLLLDFGFKDAFREMYPDP